MSRSTALRPATSAFLGSSRTRWMAGRAPMPHFNRPRYVSTLSGHPHIVFRRPRPVYPSQNLLSLLSTEPAIPQLAIGTTNALPPTPRSFTSNPSFLPILSSVYAAHATSDPDVIQQATLYAGGGTGGFIHVSDLRNPPDYGRIAWPEDIIGSIEVNGSGELNEGTWQDSGTYRVITREGILGLTEYMRGRVVEKLHELEKEIKEKKL